MDSLFEGVYAGKRVLVTGHTGFKGAWLTLWLRLLGAEVTGYSLAPPTSPSLFELCRLHEETHHVVGDVRDLATLKKVFQACQPEIVFHLAAQSLVRYSYQDPVETYSTNVMGTVNLLEAIRSTGSVRVCVNVTSDKCYDNREWDYAYRENDPMGGRDPYSSSKGCVELITAAYRDSYFKGDGAPSVCLASVRAGNVIGGGDWAPDRIIPDCMRALSNGTPVVVRNPHAIRPWQYVLEPLSGYLWLGACLWKHQGVFDQSWNFGPHSMGSISVAKVVNHVLTSWGEEGWKQLVQSSPQDLHEAHTLKLDITKATSLLGWVPVLDVLEGISETVGWYRDYFRNPTIDVRAATVAHIRRFVEIASERHAVWAAKAGDPI